MARRKSCENCREGIACRACGAALLPLPGLLSARDYTILLALIDGSDRKYAPKTLDAVATVLGCEKAVAKGRLQRLRHKLRGLLKTAQKGTGGRVDGKSELPTDPAAAREEIMRRAKAGEIPFEEAMQLVEDL